MSSCNRLQYNMFLNFSLYIHPLWSESMACRGEYFQLLSYHNIYLKSCSKFVHPGNFLRSGVLAATGGLSLHLLLDSFAVFYISYKVFSET